MSFRFSGKHTFGKPLHFICITIWERFNRKWDAFLKNGVDFIDYAWPWRLGRCCGALGALLERSWGGLGASWGPLGTLLAGLGALLGRLGTLLGASWTHLGASWRHLGKHIEKRSRVTSKMCRLGIRKWMPKSLKIECKKHCMF